jgi:hypothetical protein
MDQRSDLKSGEGVLDLGIAGGSVTALLAGALSWSAKTVIKATAVSGASYAGTQSLQPRAQLEIIDASLGALDCISSKAEAAFPAASTRALKMQPIVEAKAKILQDLRDPNLVDPEGAGEAAVKLADTFLDANQSQVYQQVRVGVDSVITAANTQMRKATADPTAVQKAFAALSVSTSTNNSTGTTPPQSPPPSGAATAAVRIADYAAKKAPAPTPADLALNRLSEDIGKLNDAIKSTEKDLDALPTNSAVLDLHGCLPGAVILVVTPSGSVSLAKSQEFELSVTGGQHAWSWSGVVPSEITVTQKSSSLYHLHATEHLVAKQSYTLVFTPYADGAQQMVTVNTVEAAAPPK